MAKWDWRAATMHLLNAQYPIAMAAAAAQYGAALGRIAEQQQQQQQRGDGGFDGGLQPITA